MNRPYLRATSVVAAAALVAAVAPAIAAVGASPMKAEEPSTGPPAHQVRAIYTSEFGVDRPTGVTYAPGRKALLIAGEAAAGTRLIEVTTGEDDRGSVLLEGLDDGDTVAFDAASRRLTAVDAGRQVSLPGAELDGRPSLDQRVTGAPSVTDARAATYARDGTWYVLDAGSDTIVTVSPDGAQQSMDLQGVDGESLAGIAYSPTDDRLYAADSDASTLYALDSTGTVVETQDLSGAGIMDLQAMTFAPTADTTDDPAKQNLFVADAGDGDTLGQVAEVSLVAATAAAANHVASLEVTRDLSLWNPSSPDPSGITYKKGADRLFISDGEVDEMPIYAGANLYTSTRGGVLESTSTTLTWSNEPTGVAHNPNTNEAYVVDDDKKSLFRIPASSTGTPPSFKTSSFGNTDPEGVAYDPVHDEVWLIDGVGTEVFRLQPGPNGTFNGVPPVGDDVASQFDVMRYGSEDPEGIEYDEVRDTLVVVDGSVETIFEIDRNGSLLNTIDISAASAVKAAGITIAPASDGSGVRHYYIVDRGLDNNSHPGENDGKLHEMSVDLAPITNRPPAANAGADQMIDLPETANLMGTALDDGVPGPMTYSWSKVAGPATGTVTFGTPNAANTTATFSAVGSYTLRLTADDGELVGFDDVVVDVYEPGAVRTTQIPIVNGADDAMEGGGSQGTFVDLSSADVELGNDGPPTPEPMLAGLRFDGLPVPQGGEIVSAKIQFKVDEVGSDETAFDVRGEAADDAAQYVSTGGNISARASTVARVPWSPPAWNLVGEAGPDQQTPELKDILQEIVDRPGWAKGNAAAFMLDGTGRRTAEAKDGLSPAVLLLQFRMLTPNQAPVVNAGGDTTVKLPATADLAGTFSDDGEPGVVTTMWSKTSGPGAVTFGDAAASTTTASFSAPGTYVLRLSANDGALTSFDEVQVVAEAADLTLTLDAAPGSVTSGAGVTVTGVLSRTADNAPVEGESVEIFVTRAPGSTRQILGTAETRADGGFALSDRPPVTTTYQAQLGALASPTDTVTVRPDVTASLSPGAVLIGTPARISGTVSPSAANQPVWLQRWNGSSWATVQRTTRPAGSSVGYAFTVRQSISGTYRYRVFLPAYAGRAAVTTPSSATGLSLRVYRGDLTRVKWWDDEFVTVRNNGAVAINLTGWRLRNLQNGREVGLPTFNLAPGRIVRIHTGAGRTDSDDLYLGRAAMWGQHGTAVLRDNRGYRVDRLGN
jgi:hypothetical protein